MGWVPITPHVVAVELERGRPARQFRVPDARDFDALVAFVVRCRTRPNEFNYVVEATMPKGRVAFRCAAPIGASQPYMEVNSPATLSHAIAASPTSAYENGLLVLRLVHDDPQPTGATAESQATANGPSMKEFIPAIAKRTAADLLSSAAKSADYRKQVMELARVRPAGRRVVQGISKRPANAANVGRDDAGPPDEISRWHAARSLKSYGSGQGSSQVLYEDQL
ncbi:unnamed protein product (mitochondrion) [Plasmodiophora brassicae]|uniref:Uncharacterized protein n=1 Tax=Plasmodiophora brassicae TaxID=37360 RepID=A0A3P3Y5J2_PLABS|nr:unnamed protein product [Plasmodiophora brassicae]